MNRTTSIYLDAVRFTAALMVFFNHAFLPRLNGEWLGALGIFGRDAVMIFFVLSGYVIAYVTAEKERTASVYAISRMARLYSVALPALVLTVLLDYAGKFIDPSVYAGGWFVDSNPIPRFIINALFLNEIWFESIRPFSNGPFWSLGYEAGYYLLFGLFCFVPGRWRWLAVALGALLLGPKIMLLFPIWLLGVAVFKLRPYWSLSAAWSWVVFISTFAAYACYVKFKLANILLDLTATWLGHELVFGQLMWSKFFLGSYCVGLLVAVNFLAFEGIADSVSRLLLRFERPIRFLAGYTFSLYLFHYPLLHFFRALTDSSIVIMTCSFVSILLLGTYTEGRKNVFKRAISRLFALVAPGRHSTAGAG